MNGGNNYTITKEDWTFITYALLEFYFKKPNHLVAHPDYTTSLLLLLLMLLQQEMRELEA